MISATVTTIKAKKKILNLAINNGNAIKDEEKRLLHIYI
jgi:hypothetical protein